MNQDDQNGSKIFYFSEITAWKKQKKSLSSTIETIKELRTALPASQTAGWNFAKVSYIWGGFSYFYWRNIYKIWIYVGAIYVHCSVRTNMKKRKLAILALKLTLWVKLLELEPESNG